MGIRTRTASIDIGTKEVDVEYADMDSFVAEITYKDDDTEDGMVMTRTVQLRSIIEDRRIRHRRDITKAHIQAAVDKVIEEASDEPKIVMVKVLEKTTVRRWAEPDDW